MDQVLDSNVRRNEQMQDGNTGWEIINERKVLLKSESLSKGFFFLKISTQR